MAVDRVDAVVNLSKRRGFVFPCGEIYGGTRSAWDYGPLGVELKENIKRQWWRSMVQRPRRRRRPRLLGDPRRAQVWEASGHVDGLHRPARSSARSCHKRFRADHLDRGVRGEARARAPRSAWPTSPARTAAPAAQFTEPRDFNMHAQDPPRPGRGRAGPALPAPRDRAGHLHQLRQRAADAARKKPPFGIAQIGKSFRNEITPGNFIFRTREFEQMEMEFFVEPGTDEEWHEYWIDERAATGTSTSASTRTNLRLYEHPQGEAVALLQAHRRHRVPLQFAGSEWAELEGIANRTDFDLKTHSRALRARTCRTSTRPPASATCPYVIEPAAGLTRCDAGVPARRLRRGRGAQRQGRRRQAHGAAARPAPGAGQGRGAAAVAQRRPVAEGHATSPPSCASAGTSSSTTPGAIGRRYRRQDEIGTPYCVTVDFDTLEDDAVTVRDRDTMAQERIGIDAVVSWLAQRLPAC